MIHFNNDYSEGCHEAVLAALCSTNGCQTPGYGTDAYCEQAAEQIRTLCANQDLAVHFLVGGTQTNLTVIAAALRPHQAVLCAHSGHINVHETGAVEGTGHKVLGLSSDDGKISACQIAEAVRSHYADESFEHIAQPKMVYLSHPTELGTLYTLDELTEISAVCRKNGLYLFVDGARLSYGLTAAGNDVTLADLARLCDVFYMGGTKCGALFGEAVVISHPALAEDFRYLVKQRGAMLAKGRLLGIQFSALLTDDVYFRIARRANDLADRIRQVLSNAGYPLLLPGVTNQIFAILPDALLEVLEKQFVFCAHCRVDGSHRAVRICTSWATTEEHVELLCSAIEKFAAVHKPDNFTC